MKLSGIGSGGRLVAIGGGEYRVEGQGNALRVQADHSRFIVTDSDGTRYYFGLTAESRQEDSAGHIYSWYPELVVHRSGESLVLYYHKGRGQLYLDRLAWGPDYRFEADLTYEDRPDQTVSFREGFEVETTERLTRIAVLSNQVELRAYHLTYDEDFTLSRLASIHMTGLSGQGSLPDLTFNYAATTGATTVTPAGTDGWQLETRGVAFFDVDGDGMDDLYRVEMGNHVYKKNLGGSFGPATALPGATALELAQVRFLDLDGDARPEMVRIVDDTWRYSRLVDGQWQTVGTWPGTRNVPLSGPGVDVADLNGDGRMDVVESVTGGLEVWFGGLDGLGAPLGEPAVDPSNVSRRARRRERADG